MAQTNPPGLPHPPPPTHSVPPTHSIPPPPMYNPFPMGPTGGGTSGGYNPFGLPYFNRPPVMINPQAPGHNKVHCMCSMGKLTSFFVLMFSFSFDLLLGYTCTCIL